jgi:hypothetical protein
MFTGGFTILTGIAGAGWALVVEREILEYMENTLKFKKTKTFNETERHSSETSSTLTHQLLVQQLKICLQEKKLPTRTTRLSQTRSCLKE